MRRFNQQIVVLVLFLVLPILIIGNQHIQSYLSRASGIQATITVDTATGNDFTPLWTYFAQGGEASGDMLNEVIPQIKALNPTYIRLDHIFDHYNLVYRTSFGTLGFNFTELDRALTSIKNTGALPFLSLSYMPSVISEDGNITQKPRDWNEWSYVVQKTIEHVSGTTALNLTNVYYEVWNEPDLFGNWKTSGSKNYLTLYEFAALGAASAQNTNSFKFGGPSTTNLYKDWTTDFATYVTTHNLRLDFYSWHLYSKNVQDFTSSTTTLSNWLSAYPTLKSVPYIISEWGIDSEMSPDNDNERAPAHTIATYRALLGNVSQAYLFELVDGLDPASREYWGRWGLITHPTKGNHTKPHYESLILLNKLKGARLPLTGEGTWVTGIAAKDAKITRILLTNYSTDGMHTENVPITVQNLAPGMYTVIETRLGLSSISKKVEIIGQFQTTSIMPANGVMLLELVPQF